MKFEDITKMIDISCVAPASTAKDIDVMVELAKRYRFICCFAMPQLTPYLHEQIMNDYDILLGGVVGFPSGGDLTITKIFTAKELLKIGCDELDMVINVGAMKSGMYDLVFEDIKAVVDIAGKTPVKSILEVAYLTDYEIQKASELAVKAGVTFVKTGTGWSNKPSTVEHIRLIKQTVGDAAKIKAAGGVRDMETIEAMINAGCSRFGLGINTILSITKEQQILTADSY